MDSSLSFHPRRSFNTLRLVEAIAYLLAFLLHGLAWHVYRQQPAPPPPVEPPVIEAALIVQPKPTPAIQQTQAAAPPPPAAPVAPPKPKLPAPPKPVAKVEKTPPKEKPVIKKAEKPIVKPKPEPSERHVREEPREESREEAPPAPPAPVREAPSESREEARPAPAVHHRRTEEEGESEGRKPAHKAAAGSGEDNHFHPGGLSGFKRRYPHIAQERGWEGTVTLKVHIGADGDIGEVIVVGSSGHDVLDEAAVDLIKEARATPARRGDNPVDSWVVVPYRFTIPK